MPGLERNRLHAHRSIGKCYGRAPAARFGRRVAETHDKRGAGEDGAHHLPLRADAAAVNLAQRAKAATMNLDQILLDYGFHIARRDAMEIEDIGIGIRTGSSSNSAADQIGETRIGADVRPKG